MIPTSFILTAVFVFLLFPPGKSQDFLVKKEREVKNNISMSVDLHLSSIHKNATILSDDAKKTHTKSKINSPELPPESFTEIPLQMEDWMKYPKKWNNNNEL